MMKTLASTLCAAVLTVCAAQPASGREWNVVIGSNDQAGKNWGAHTVSKHVGQTEAQLKARVQREGVTCASSYWYEWDASYFINRALAAEDQMRSRYGYASLDQTLAGMSDGQQIILRQFNLQVDPAWFYGIYTKKANTVYSANGIRVVLKKVPASVSPDKVIVLVSFPDIDPLYNSICLPEGVQ